MRHPYVWINCFHSSSIITWGTGSRRLEDFQNHRMWSRWCSLLYSLGSALTKRCQFKRSHVRQGSIIAFRKRKKNVNTLRERRDNIRKKTEKKWKEWNMFHTQGEFFKIPFRQYVIQSNSLTNAKRNIICILKQILIPNITICETMLRKKRLSEFTAVLR